MVTAGYVFHCRLNATTLDPTFFADALTNPLRHRLQHGCWSRWSKRAAAIKTESRPKLIEFLKRASPAALALITALAFSPAAQAAEAHHPGHPGGGIHIGGGGGGGGGRPIAVVPHNIAPGLQGGGVKHNYNGNPARPLGLVPNRHQNPGAGIVSRHPGGGVTKHWDRDGDHDGDHHEHHAHHRRGHLFVYGVPYYDNYYDDSYGDDTCRYFWHRYQQTGNPKWKWRYYDCIG
jgi:hypothetical protein